MVPGRSACPVAVCLDPFRTLRRRHRQQKIKDRDGPPLPATATDGHDLGAAGQVDVLNSHVDPEDLRLERNREVFDEHRMQAGDLLVLVVGQEHYPAVVPALRSRGRAVQAARRAADLPHLFRPHRRGALRPLRRGARASDPGRHRSAAVPELPVQRPDQPGGLCRLPTPPPGRGAHGGRAVVPELPPAPETDLRDVRAVRAMRSLPGQWSTVV